MESTRDAVDEASSVERKPKTEECKSVLCYCGKERTMAVEVLCATCNRWIHEACIGFQLGKLVPFATNYIFFCKICSPTGVESFRRCQATIPQMCVTALANLHRNAVKDNKSKQLFNKDQEIIPYIEQYWDSMTTLPRRVTQSWYATVQRALVKDIHTVYAFEETDDKVQMFGLLSQDFTQIKPNYDAMVKGGMLRITDDGYTQASLSKGGRPNKRKLPGNEVGPAGKKGRPAADISANVKLPAHGYPLEHPFNKDGYRYILAEPDPHAPFRQEFDESADWAGKPIPGWLYRTLSPNSVLLALHDRAPQLKIAEDRLAVTGEKGYCTVRASHFVTRGSWYYEATIEEMPDGAGTRIGWGQEYANLQAPLGYDRFGYSWRSRKGTKFHESCGKSYSAGYGEGDTLGFLIVLPQTAEHSDYMPNTFKDRPLVKFKSHLYYEDKDRVNDALKTLKPAPQSKIIFFKNGESQGEAFVDIFQGAYYPAFSIFRNATVSVNFGPTFKYPEVEEQFQCKGIHARVEDLICEQSLADMMYLTENSGKLRLDAFTM